MYAYPTPLELPYAARVLFDQGRFLEAPLLKRTERKLAGPGPRNGRCLRVTVERREALRLALGARGRLAPRGGYVTPASKGARWSPGASRRSTPSRSSRGTRQTSDASRRENAKVW